MASKISLGLSKKIGLPNYSSIGASCELECEVDFSVLQEGTERFQAEAARLFGLCLQAVEERLAREAPGGGVLPRAGSNGHAAALGTVRPASGAVAGCHEESVDERDLVEVGLSERQLAFIQDLASQIGGLGIRRLPALVALQFDKNLTELTTAEASQLIGVLRQVRSGSLPLDRLLEHDQPER